MSPGPHIRPLRLDDDADVHAFYVANHAAEVAENPRRPVWTEQVMRGFLIEPTPDEKVEAWVACSDDSASADVWGGGVMFIPQLDNLDKAYLGVSIAPEYARRGAGGAVLETLCRRATQEHRRTTLLCECTLLFDSRDGHGYRRFAERHGFAMASVEVSRRLDLPVAEERIQEWIDAAASRHADYRIETFTDIPDELLASLCHVQNQLALDAPTGDIEFEAERITPEVMTQHQERARRNGITVLHSVAIDPAGNAVAVSAIGVVADDPGKAHQWATIVQKEHRGHRLGLAVKAANLRELQRTFPDRTVIFTQNHEENAHMVSINELVGFRPVELCVEFQRFEPAS